MKQPLLNITCLLLLFNGLCFGQIEITFPTERAVFQRNNNNEAVIYIGGYITESFTSIEARFIPLVEGEGQPAPGGGGWEVIQTNPTGGNYYGALTVKGGWYKLEVRGIKDGQQPKVTTLQRVGAGEVFLVAGQSNATGGDSNSNGPGAMYDQVNSVNFQNYDPAREPNILPYSDVKIPCPVYAHLDASVKTAPFGNYAWCWGAFGDKVYEKLRVPVMIFNSGWSSSAIHNWQETIDSTAYTISSWGYAFPQGMPFGHIKLALNNYTAQLGVRAVLWHQGESDNYIERGSTESVDWYNRYLTKLWEVIKKCRDRSAKSNLAWVVARASRFDYPQGINRQTTVSANVINAQNEIINNDALYPHVYQGPDTDPYYSLEYRGDEVHFRGDGVTVYPDGHVYSGLLHLAKFWADKITETTFLSESTPYAASPPPYVTANAVPGSTNIRLSAPTISPTPKFDWFMPADGCTQYINHSQEFTTGVGTYQLKITDAYNNQILSPRLYVSANTALPVTWLYFTAEPTVNNYASPNRALLKWATTSETNASHFDVERSNDAVTFKKITSVLAAGDARSLSQYSYTDEAATAGTYYYRLKQVDLDGTFGYSRIVTLKTQGKERVKLYPNPVTDKMIIESEANLNLVEITSLNGTKIYSSIHKEKYLEVDVQEFAPGLYTVTVDGKTFKVAR